ncbi:MAG: hypothetical protein ACKOA8_15570, partial [Deltaproteobacteria bacterium]
MKSKSLTTEPLREVDILREMTLLLNQTLETEGQMLWAKLFQEKTAHGNPSHPGIMTFSEAQANLKNLVQEISHSSFKGKIQLAFQLGIQSTTLFSSAFLGLILPQNNIILFKKDQKQDAITVERATLFVSELFLDWMDTILAKTLEKAQRLENLKVKHEIGEHLKLTQKITQNAKAGLQRGSSLRNKGSEFVSKVLKKPRKEIRIPLEARAFLALE